MIDITLNQGLGIMYSTIGLGILFYLILKGFSELLSVEIKGIVKNDKNNC